MNVTTDSREPIEPESTPAPVFGLVDIVDAFTAMRHEWRNQSKEGRQLADAVQTTGAKLTELEDKLDKKLAMALDEKRLKSTLAIVIDLDISLRRAIAAASAHRTKSIETRKAEKQQLKQQLQQSVESNFRQQGFLHRFVARKFFNSTVHTIDEVISTQQQSDNADTTIEGLHIIQSRLQWMMDEENLTRADTLGKPFDGQSMNAISSLVTAEYEAGTVAEEISPAYYYQSQLIKYAEVRVAAADVDNTLTVRHNITT